MIDSQGFLVTALHVVENARSVNVQFPGGSAQSAQVVMIDIPNDLAVLRTEAQGQTLPTLPIADTMRAGQDAIIIGYPLCSGPDPTVTKGIVSGVNRIGPIGGMAVVQIDAAMNPGNSGGPVLTTEGAVIGVANQTMTRVYGQAVQATNFAIPYDTIRALAAKASDPSRSHNGLSFPLQTTVQVPLSYKGSANMMGKVFKDVVCASPPPGALKFMGVHGQLQSNGSLAIKVFLTLRPDEDGTGEFGVLARYGAQNVQVVDQDATRDYKAADVCMSYVAQGRLPGFSGLIPLGFEATYAVSFTVWSSEVTSL